MHRLKRTFTAGELSPLMGSRVDFDRYQNGCKVLKNMTCLTQGPVTRRPGFEFIYDLNSLDLNLSNPQVRMIEFIFNEVQAYVMIFFRINDGNKVRMILGTQSGIVLGSGDEKEYAEQEFDYVSNGSYDYHHVIPEPFDSTKFKVIRVAADGTEVELVYDPTDTIAVSYNVTIDNDNLPNVVTTVSASAAFEKLKIYQLITPTLDEVVTLDLPAEWDIENFDHAQSADEMWFAQSSLQPYVIKRHAHDVWELVELTFTDQPDDWSDNAGWPERITFHQQRVAFATNLIRRQTVWMSKAGDFLDFGKNSPLLDSDAVTFTLDSGTQNKIQWLVSGKALLIGTLGNEWTVTGATISSLTPTNILAQRQTNNGSEPTKPLLINLTSLFVEKHGRVVNEFLYDYSFDSYKTTDLAILAPHLTEFYSIIDWAYQQTPDSIVWAVRGDGDLLGLTYQRPHKVLGWHHHDTEGEFKTTAAIPGDTREDDVWVVTMRTIEDGDHYYVEKMAEQFKSENATDAKFMDSFLEYVGPKTPFTGYFVNHSAKEITLTVEGHSFREEDDYVRIFGLDWASASAIPDLVGLNNELHNKIFQIYNVPDVNHITVRYEHDSTDCYLSENGDTLEVQVGKDSFAGLDHLEGKTIQVLTHGATHPDRIVVNGTVDLVRGSTHVVFGLSFISEVRPYLVEVPDDLGGTSIGKTQRVTYIDIDFFRTLGCTIGKHDSEDGEFAEEKPFRVPGDLIGQAVPLSTGIYELDFMEGFDEKVEYFIRQTYPLPMTVRSVVDRVETFQ